MPPARRGTTKAAETATRPDGSVLYSDAKADGTPVFQDRTVTVNPVPGLTKTYPDVTDQWAVFMVENGGATVLRSSWEFMRNCQVTFMRDKRMTSIEGWCYLDDTPTAYLVKAYPKPGQGRRQVAYDIVGAVRLDEIAEPSEVARLNPDLAEGDDDD